MRSQKRFLVSGLLVMAGIVLIAVGCSDDDSTAGGPVAGSPDDPQFLLVREMSDALADSTVTFFEHGLSTLKALDESVLPPQYTVDPGGDGTLTTDYQNGWHIIGLTSLQTGMMTTVNDSIQFSQDGVPQQVPNGLDQMTFIHHWFRSLEVETEVDTIIGYSHLVFTNLYGERTEVNGETELSSVSHVAVDDTTTAVVTFEVTAELVNFQLDQSATPGWLSGFDEFDYCPCQGHLTATVTMNYQVEGLQAEVSAWTVDMTLTYGQVNVAITCGNTVWTYDNDVCQPSGD